jgi:predicted homoserine dehydrogenase-like protein
LAHQVTLKRPVAQGQSLTWDDVAIDTSSRAYALRREMEHLFTRVARSAPVASRAGATI